MRSPRSRRLLIGGLVAVLALALVAGPAAAKSPQQSSSETDTVRLGVFANVTHAPGLVAIESGLLQEELGPDVKLEVQYFNAGPTVITALLAGAIDVSYIGPNPAITGFAESDGEALRIISGSTSGGAALVVKPGITKVSQLKGKKIATPQLGNTQDVAARAYFKEKGLSTDVTGGGDVSILPTPNATTLESFKQGLIDGAWVPEPWYSRLVNEAGAKELVDEASLWPNGQFVTTHLIGATDFVDDNPKTVQKLLEGQHRRPSTSPTPTARWRRAWWRRASSTPPASGSTRPRSPTRGTTSCSRSTRSPRRSPSRPRTPRRSASWSR